jgi:thiamine transport system substrate-binding protein
VWVALATTALVTTSCSLVGGDDDGGDESKRVVLVTHESFVISDELKQQFEQESGFDLVVKASGDAGAADGDGASLDLTSAPGVILIATHSTR